MYLGHRPANSPSRAPLSFSYSEPETDAEGTELAAVLAAVADIEAAEESKMRVDGLELRASLVRAGQGHLGTDPHALLVGSERDLLAAAWERRFEMRTSREADKPRREGLLGMVEEIFTAAMVSDGRPIPKRAAAAATTAAKTKVKSSQGLLFSEARKPCAEAAGHGCRG